MTQEERVAIATDALRASVRFSAEIIGIAELTAHYRPASMSLVKVTGIAAKLRKNLDALTTFVEMLESVE